LPGAAPASCGPLQQPIGGLAICDRTQGITLPNDIVIEGAFVPADRSLEVMRAAKAESPGGQFHEGHIYRPSLFAVFGCTLVGAGLGGALGATCMP